MSSTNITFLSPRKQYFSFPPDVISYLWKNPLPAKSLYKLKQTCKYFYAKRQILFLPEYYIGKYADEYFPEKKIYKENELFWFKDKLSICGRLTEELTKVYHCTLKYLGMCETTLFIGEFEFLVSDKRLEKFILSNASIKYQNGSIVSVDVILQKMPNVTYFVYKNNREKNHVSTLQKMVLLNLFKKIQYFSLDFHCVSKTFDSNYLCFFIQKFVASSAVINFHITSKNYYHLQYVTQTTNRNMEAMLQRWNDTIKPLVEVTWKKLKY